MQFTQLSSGGFFTYVGNADRSSSRGIRGDGRVQVGRRFVDPAERQLHRCPSRFWRCSPYLGGKTTAGTPLPSVPPYKVSAVAGYNTDLGNDYGLELSGDVDFVGSQHTKLEEGGVYTDPIFGGRYVVGAYLHAYSSGNIRAQVTKDNYSVAFYIKNVWNNTNPIADDNYLPVFGQPFDHLQPRTFGLEFAAKL